MTLLAARPELAFVRINASMASVAIGRQWCRQLAGWRRVTVAASTRYLAMLAVEPVLGSSIVIKIPQWPTTRIVTSLASGS